MYECNKCGEHKPEDAYEIRRDKKVPTRRKECRACMNKRKTAHYHKNPISYKLKEAKRRANAKGWDFNITEADVVIPEFCPLLGIPLEINTHGASHNSPSIDRIDSTKGYVKGNVWIISHRANTVKNDASLQELELITANLRKLQGQ